MKDDKWDIRGVKKLSELFPRPRSGYWYKVGQEKAQQIANILSEAYGVVPPKVVVDISTLRKEDCNAMYIADKEEILMYSRNHAKSIIHEFYHHLDNKTDGEYDSNDWIGGRSSLSWMFADVVWEYILRDSKQEEICPRCKVQALKYAGEILVDPNNSQKGHRKVYVCSRCGYRAILE